MRPSPYVYPGLFFHRLDDILIAVCEATGIDEADIRSKRRRREFVTARQVYCYIARKKTGISYCQIGEMLSDHEHKYNHATVMHSIKQVEGFLSINDKMTVSLINEVNKLL